MSGQTNWTVNEHSQYGFTLTSPLRQTNVISISEAARIVNHLIILNGGKSELADKVSKSFGSVASARCRDNYPPQHIAERMPAWNCVDYPDKPGEPGGPHYTPGTGHCGWCGKSNEEMARDYEDAIRWAP